MNLNRVAFKFLEFMGLVLDTGMILEDELEDVRRKSKRKSLNKIDRYFYETISSVLR